MFRSDLALFSWFSACERCVCSTHNSCSNFASFSFDSSKFVVRFAISYKHTFYSDHTSITHNLANSIRIRHWRGSCRRRSTWVCGSRRWVDCSARLHFVILSREWNVPCLVRTALHALAARRSSEDQEKTVSVLMKQHLFVHLCKFIQTSFRSCSALELSTWFSSLEIFSFSDVTSLVWLSREAWSSFRSSSNSFVVFDSYKISEPSKNYMNKKIVLF